MKAVELLEPWGLVEKLLVCVGSTSRGMRVLRSSVRSWNIRGSDNALSEEAV